MRPGVVWFGEALDPEVWRGAMKAVQSADALVVIGTSGEVYPAAGLVEVAASAGAKVVEVNLEEGPLDSFATVALHGRAAEVLPQIDGAD